MKVAVGEWITNLTVIAILGALVDILLPNSSFRKYSSFLFGLVILILFLQPVLKLMGQTQDFDASIYQKTATQNAETVSFQSSQLEKGQKQQLEKVVQKNLEKDLAVQLENETDWEPVSVQITFSSNNGETDLSQLDRIDVSAVQKGQTVSVDPVVIGTDEESGNPQMDAEGVSEIKQFLSERYGIEKDRIYVNRN